MSDKSTYVFGISSAVAIAPAPSPSPEIPDGNWLRYSRLGVRNTCDGCGGDYDKLMACDLVIPREQWLAINPRDGGLLCANCMVRRAAALPGTVNITGRITTGDDNLEVYRTLSDGPKASQHSSDTREGSKAEGHGRPNQDSPIQTQGQQP